MDPALHYGIYREEIDKQIILKHIKYIKSCYLYDLAKDHIWRN